MAPPPHQLLQRREDEKAADACHSMPRGPARVLSLSVHKTHDAVVLRRLWSFAPRESSVHSLDSSMLLLRRLRQDKLLTVTRQLAA
jgi:hypothetical protein